MKLTTEKKDVIKSQEFETTTYGVSTENLPLLFQMLRTNLYSDIHGSIIREVVSNVVDSHTEAGKPGTIGEVEWVDENRLMGIDSQLIIRDFGIGLSPDRMKNIYGNYLSSTKRDDNNSIGGFGLGSKVPFAYTDSFFVNTVSDGVRYKYLCYIDETQLGAISLLSKENVTAGNGTEIIIPVKHKYDKEKFQNAIFRQLSYFTNIRYINFVAPKNKIIYEDDNCIILEQAPFSDLHLVLGSVAYPIDSAAAGIDRWTDGIGNCQLGLKFKIGDLQPTLSRESLFWNETVKKKVHAKMALARKGIREQIEKDLDAEKDYARWYSNVTLQKSKSFPSQWNFSKVKTSAEYITSTGKRLPIRTTPSVWFSGMNIRTVTPFVSYGRRAKAKNTKNPDYSTSNSNVNDLVDKPIYRLEGNLTSRQALFLFKTNPSGFVVVSDSGLASLDVSLAKECKLYYEEAGKWRAALPKFDDIVVPDGEFETTGDLGYKEAYKKLVQQRKLEGKFTAKILRKKDSWSNDLTDQFEYNKFEGKFEDQKDNFIIYGTQEESTDLVKVGGMVTFSSLYVDTYGKLKDTAITILKIGTQYVKQFEQLPNAYHVAEVFKMNTPLNKHFVDVHEAFKAKVFIEQYALLSDIGGINKSISTKYGSLKTFVIQNTIQQRFQTDLLKEIVTLCTKSGSSNKAIATLYQELLDYTKDLDLLKHILRTKEALPAIKDYLILKKKAVDSQPVVKEKEKLEVACEC